MKTLLSFSLAALIATAVLPSFAEDQAAPAAIPATAASMPQDCAKPAMKRHDHGAERGTGVSAAASDKGAPCTSEAAASAAPKTAKKKLAHDHAKFHKNQ
jgi:hypothetical protein